MSPAIFESHRRTPSGQDPDRRKSGSGFLFLNNRFKSMYRLSRFPLFYAGSWTRFARTGCNSVRRGFDDPHQTCISLELSNGRQPQALEFIGLHI
ncbi:uncharacterized protein ColSpa_11498 [Colletotrichum spaethianum]|uniref:Uncharacterized protein n=1 Tax=Colletotrichum spaethianum TaxID=700344 RepID=A0AA37URR8_9PEZI|nr:uncharacterized protein ColSpa_11498 [Colletotrichum spaethianum]GKT51317.1 hypothetical protein ColSpa_11498 [Colletotrichum spaethianum]